MQSSSSLRPWLRTITRGDRVSLHASIDELARDEWDALAGDDVLASHGWLATVERTRLDGGHRRYVGVRRAGRLVGAVACTQSERTNAVQTVDHVVFGRARAFAARGGLSLLPALVCGPLRAAGCLPLVDRCLDAADRGRVLDAILDAIDDEAARRALAVCFTDVAAHDDELRSRLMARGYQVALDTPRNVLDIAWDSFDAYLRHLDQVTRGARKDVRRQINQNQKRGTTIVTLERPELEAERLHELLSLNERAHNGRPFGFSRDFFAVVKQRLGSDAVLYAARKDGRITATALLLRRGGRGELPMVGVDHATAGNDFTFFNVAHYRPIADAIADGIGTLSFGRALYGLKARRGCRLEDTLVLHRARSRSGRLAVAGWFALLSRWNRAKRVGRA